MTRRTTARTTARGVVAALAVLAVTAGPGPLAVTADADNGAGGTAFAAEKVFQVDRYLPRRDRIYSAGPHGYLHAQEDRSGFLWTSYDTGTTTELGDLARLEVPAYLGSSSDVVADVVSPTQKVVLRDLSAGTTTDVALTHGAYAATFGTHVLTQARDTAGNRVLWLYGDGAPAEGTLVDGWPTGITANFTVLGGDSGTAVLGYTLGNGTRHLALVDLATASQRRCGRPRRSDGRRAEYGPVGLVVRPQGGARPGSSRPLRRRDDGDTARHRGHPVRGHRRALAGGGLFRAVGPEQPDRQVRRAAHGRPAHGR